MGSNRFLVEMSYLRNLEIFKRQYKVRSITYIRVRAGSTEKKNNSLS